MQNKIEKKKILWEVGEAGSGLHFIKMRVEGIKKTAAQNRVHALQRIQQMEVLHQGESKKKGRRQSEHGAAKEQNKQYFVCPKQRFYTRKMGNMEPNFPKKNKGLTKQAGIVYTVRRQSTADSYLDARRREQILQQAQISDGSKKTAWTKFKRQLWRNRYIYMMVLPVVLYMILFKYMPMWFLRSSFYNYKLLKGFDSQYVGLKWFEKLFSNPHLWHYIGNTLKLNISAVVFLFPLPMIFAIMLNELRSVPFKKTVQTISYLPHFVSTVVLVSMIMTILSPSLGLLGKLSRAMGATPINYLADPDYFVIINVISGAWQSIGWDAVIYVSALTGIDQGLYEAARIDGANRWKQILHITLPGLMTTFILILIMRMGQMLSVNFEKVYLLQNNLNRSASEMLPTFIYRTGMESHNYGYATAAGLFNSVVSLVLVFAANKLSRRVTDISLM